MPDEADAARTVPREVPRWRDLKARVLAGVGLAGVAFALLALGQRSFALLVLCVGLFMAWEWGRMIRGATFDVPFYVHAGGVASSVLLALAGYPALGLAALGVAALVILGLELGRKSTMSAQGVFYVGLPALSLLWLRGDPGHGFWAVLLIVACVVATDTFAFFTGRQIGGPKLWPAVSPNKTWSGLIGGVTASAVVAALFALVLPGASVARLIPLGIGLGLVAQAGDLAESALKRLFSVKDASSLIPGHGGFMDRMDGIVTAATAAALVALVVNPAMPARALLLGQ